MLQKIFKVCLQNLPTDVELSHPLHIGLDSAYIKAHTSLVKDVSTIKEGSFVGALMREYPIIFDSLECLFIQIEITNSNLIPSDEEIRLYITEDFLTHYNFNYDDICYFKSVVCFDLDKVVLGAKTTGSYAWFKDFKDLDRHKDLVVQCCNKKFLCRQDDALLVDPSKHSSKQFSFQDYITLDCQPFRQGFITLKSSLIVADLRDATDPSTRKVKRLMDSPDVISLGKYALSLINYTSSNFLGIRLRSNDVSASYTPLNTLKFLCSFEIRVMSKFNMHFDKELSKLDVDVDPLNTVFLSCNIGKKMYLSNGSWAKINILEPIKNKSKSPVDAYGELASERFYNTEGPNSIRLAQICHFTDEQASSHYFPNDKIVYISPHLWFNLNKQPSLLMQPHLRLQIEVAIYL